MSTGGASNGPLGSTRAAPGSEPIALKLLEASVALMRCRDLLGDDKNREARIEMNRAQAVLDELESQSLSEQQTRQVVALLQSAVRLEARLRLFAMGFRRAG